MDLEFFDWAEEAACRGVGYTVPSHQENPFFKEGRGKTYDIAREFCEGCTVVIDCLIEGLREDNIGFWGGTSNNERFEIRKMMREGDMSFEVATEVIWKHHRDTGRPVPSITVWNDWDYD